MAPLLNVQEGDWAVYEMLDGYGQRLTAVATDRADVRLRLEGFRHRRPVGLPTTITLPVDYDAGLDDSRLSAAEAIIGDTIDLAAREETIQAASRNWSARRTEAVWDEEGVHYVRTTWVSPDAPLSGLVRQETRADGKLTHRTELVAHGRGQLDATAGEP